MIQEKMTVHKALCELKTMDDRIHKAVIGVEYVRANRHNNDTINGKSIEEYEDGVVSDYQSAVDLIARRNAIKRAVVLSNASTKVTVAKQGMTVAEAIEMKRIGTEYQRSLMQRMSMAFDAVSAKAERDNGRDLEERADAYIVSLYGRQADVKNLTDKMKSDRENFVAAHKTDIIDPLNVQQRIKELEKSIYDFETDVDAALSVSNATTEITVEYETAGMPI